MTQTVTQFEALDIVKSIVHLVHEKATKRQIREQSQKVLKSLRNNSIVYDEECCCHIRIQVEASTADELGLRVTINHDDEQTANTQFIDFDPVKAQGLTLMALFAAILQRAPSRKDAVHLAWLCRSFLVAADYAHRFPKHALPYDEAPFEYEQAA